MPVSTFLLTVNSNVTEQHVSKEQLSIVMNDILQNIVSFVRYRDRTRASSQYINGVEILGSVIEVGERYSRVHNHSLVQIHHDTNIQLRADKISKVAADMLGLESIHIDLAYVREGDVDRTLRYLGKSQH